MIIHYIHIYTNFTLIKDMCNILILNSRDESLITLCLIVQGINIIKKAKINLF